MDIVDALNASENPRNYWKVIKNRLKKEGSQVVTNCNRLKMEAEDGKMRETDVADTETMFRIIQSIPSPKAEPWKEEFLLAIEKEYKTEFDLIKFKNKDFKLIGLPFFNKDGIMREKFEEVFKKQLLS